MNHHEEAEQKALFDWAQYQPRLRWMFAIPNGGNRNPREAARLKAGGVKKGVSDILLPIRSTIPIQSNIESFYCGLFIEMKRRKVDGPSSVSQDQVDFHIAMTMAGYKCVVCYGADEAITAIIDYLDGC